MVGMASIGLNSSTDHLLSTIPQMLFFLSKCWFFTGITSERIYRARLAGEATAVMLAER